MVVDNKTKEKKITQERRALRHLHNKLVRLELESLRKEMTLEDMKEVAREINYMMRDRRVAVLINGYTAHKFYTGIFKPVLEKSLPNYESNYIVRILKHLDIRTGEVRKIITKPEEVRVPNTEDILTVVYSAESGWTHNGTIDWVLDNINELGVERVTTLVGLDYQGCAHLPIARQYTQYWGPVEFLRLRAPNTYKKHVENDKIKFLANYIPERNWLVKEMSQKYANYLNRLLYHVTRGKKGVPSSIEKDSGEVLIKAAREVYAK